MKTIFLASVTPYVGKNVIAVGLFERLRRLKLKVGYFKPIGPLATRHEGGMADEDALFFRNVLKLAEPIEAICPLVMSDETVGQMLRGRLENAKERILDAFKTVSAGKDCVVAVGMGRLSAGVACGYSMEQFVRDVDARLLVVERYRWPSETLDGILQMKARLPEQFGGVIFNRLQASTVTQINRSVRPFLKAQGVELFGAVPDDAVLNAVPIGDIVAALGGKVLCGGDRLDTLVENFSIGAMNPDAALRFFQGVVNKAVITGGDRADIQLAALQTSTRCLVLTGGLYPNGRILARAEELGVPVLLVPQETSATVEVCERLHGQTSLHSERKVARAYEVLDKNVDWALLEEKLGIK